MGKDARERVRELIANEEPNDRSRFAAMNASLEKVRQKLLATNQAEDGTSGRPESDPRFWALQDAQADLSDWRNAWVPAPIQHVDEKQRAHPSFAEEQEKLFVSVERAINRWIETRVINTDD